MDRDAVWFTHGPKETWGAHWRNLANTIELSMFGGPAKTAEPIEMLFRVWTRCTQGTMR